MKAGIFCECQSIYRYRGRSRLGRDFVNNRSTVKSEQTSWFCSLVTEEAHKCEPEISAGSVGRVECIWTGVKYVIEVVRYCTWPIQLL